jgi:hypothetical protein
MLDWKMKINKFGSFQLTYHDAIVILAVLPFFLHSRPIRLSLPNPLPSLMHSSDSHSHKFSHCVCASGLSGVVVVVLCSCRCSCWSL